MKNLFLFLTLLVLSVSAQAQQNQTQKDSTKTQKLDEVLVNAIRVKKTDPITHSNVTKADLEKRNLGQDIPVLLNYLPSVVSSSDAGAGIGYTYMRVRGSDGSRINVTINGIPYNDAESQGTFWVNLGDLASSTESIQLQRGVGTSTNGSGAFGASLNILTDAVSNETSAEISNSFGSFGTRKHTVEFNSGTLNDHFSISARLSNIHSDGYVDRAFTDYKTYFLQGAYVDDNTLIKALAFGGKERTYQAWFGLTADELKEDRRQNPYTYDNETDNYWQDHYQFHWNERLNNSWSTNLGLNYTKGKGYFEQFKGEESAEDFNNLIEDDSDVIVRRWLDNDFYVVNANVEYKQNRLNVITGLSFSNYTGDHFGEVIWGNSLASNTNINDRYYFSDAKKNEISLFSKANFEITEALSGYVDIQGRFVKYKTKGLTSKRNGINVNESFNFFNPKLGLTYALNTNNSLYGSFARANREPNRDDFENGIDTYESLNDFEFGWRLNTENVQLNANIYYMNYRNQLVLTGALDDVGAPVRTTSGKSYRLGLELDANIKISEQLSLRPNLALSKNRNVDFYAPIDGDLTNLGDTPLSFSPSVIGANTLIFQPVKNFQISFLSKFVGEQFMSNLNSKVTNLDKLDAYFTSDLSVTYVIETKAIFKSIVLSGLVNNIFNAEYVDRGYYYTYDDTWSAPGVTSTIDGSGYYPQATTNFLLGATLKF